MKTVWKWVLGIAILLAVVGVIAGAAFLWRGHMLTAYFRGPQPFTQRQNGPFHQPYNSPSPNPNRDGPFYHGPMMHRNFGFPMMGGREFMRFGFFPFGMGFLMIDGLLRWFLPLVVLVLVAILFYQLGKHAGASGAMASIPPAPVVSGPTASEAPAEKKRGRAKKTE